MLCATTVFRQIQQNVYVHSPFRAVQGSKIAVGVNAFVQFCSPTFFGLRKMLRIFLIANQKTSYTMERYAQVALNEIYILTI
jgi:hypothetical protein